MKYNVANLSAEYFGLLCKLDMLKKLAQVIAKLMSLYHSCQLNPTPSPLEGHTPTAAPSTPLAITPAGPPLPQQILSPLMTHKLANDAKISLCTVQEVLIKGLKVLKRACNTCRFLYLCLNKDNLHVNNMFSIILLIHMVRNGYK